MRILTRLTAGSMMRDPREGKSTSPSEITTQEIAMAAGTLDWFAYDLVMGQHCFQFPKDSKKTLKEIERIFVNCWQKGKGPESISRKRMYKISICLWNDFLENGRFTDAERANMCGMTDRHWRRGTNEVYKSTLAELNTISSKAYRDIKYQLRSDI